MWDRELKRSRVILVALLLLAGVVAVGCGSGTGEEQAEEGQRPEYVYQPYQPSRSEPLQIADTSDLVVPQPEEPEALPPGEPTDDSVEDSAGPEEMAAVVEEEEVQTVSYDAAEAVFHDGRFEESTRLFTLYCEQHPDNPWGHYMQGLSAWKAGDHGQAETAFGRALELDPRHAKSLRNLGRVLLELQRPEEAVIRIEAALELEPESGETYRLMGRSRHELGRIEESIEAYRQAILLDGEDAWAMNNLGLILIQQERFEEALPSLARAVELRDDVAVFQNNLGIALERTGHFSASAEAYRVALELDGGYDKAALSLERVEGRQESPDLDGVDLVALARGFEEQIEGQRQPSSVEVEVARDLSSPPEEGTSETDVEVAADDAGSEPSEPEVTSQQPLWQLDEPTLEESSEPNDTPTGHES